jgi:hypothetical protein
MLTGYGNTGGTGKETISTGANSNGNNINSGLQINTSPVSYFFANASTLYVADSGNPKNNSANSTLGDGGLQKWVNSGGTWSLVYTLYKGLNLVANTTLVNGIPSGTTGLYGLTGSVVGNTVQLYATNYTLNDLDATYLYGITDTLSDTTASQASSETFSLLATAPSDSNFKGVSFTPTVAAPATPTISWPAPAAIADGSALSSLELDATSSAPGTLVYTPALGTVLPDGANQTLSVAFTPANPALFMPAIATTTITVNPASAPASPANLVATKVLTRNSTNLVVQLTVTNTGGTAATNVTLTSVKVGADVASPLANLGTIAAGASVTATLTVPASVGNSGAGSSFTLSGTYTGGSFSSSARITLP